MSWPFCPRGGELTQRITDATYWFPVYTINTYYNDVIMGAIASQSTSLTIVYSTVYSGAHQRKHQSSASLAFVRGIHRWPVNSPHKWPVTRKTFPFVDVIMNSCEANRKDLCAISISHKTSCCEISQSLEGTRSCVKMFVSLCNLTYISAAAQPTCQSIFRAIGRF